MNLKKPTKIIEKGIRVLVTTGGGRRGGELDEGNQKVKTRDFPGGPVAKTPSSHARAWVLFLVRELDPTCQN